MGVKMTDKRTFDLFMGAFYSAYVNIAKKLGMEPIEFRQFKTRMKIWEW